MTIRNVFSSLKTFVFMMLLAMIALPMMLLLGVLFSIAMTLGIMWLAVEESYLRLVGRE